MSEIVKPIISYEGTSVVYEHNINLEENNISGRKFHYPMRDWSLVSATVTFSCTTASGDILVKQAMESGGVSFDLEPSAVTLTPLAGDTVGEFQLQIGGRYLVLDFGSTTLPDSGRISIIVIGKRGS